MMKFDKPVESIAMRFAKALAERGMTQKDVIDRTGISSASLSQYATGKVQPKQDRIYLIAKALNVSEVWLMGFDVPMERAGKFKTVNTDTVVDFMFDDDAKKLVETFNSLSDKKKEMLLDFAKNLSEL